MPIPNRARSDGVLLALEDEVATALANFYFTIQSYCVKLLVRGHKELKPPFHGGELHPAAAVARSWRS